MNLRHYNPEILKRLREEKGRTQETVASTLKMTRQTVYRAEKGLDVPNELLCDFADYYSIPVVSLLYPTPLPLESKAAA
jgi:DNA-binding XRE family transcriptional regulator